MTATVRRVARPRGSLTPDQRRRLERSAEKRAKAEADYRAEVLAVMAEGGSFAEVAKATGLSTNTLQRWKAEAVSPDGPATPTS
jgi:DNA-directed RNA polymerase specialized sigma24 family protein